MIGIRGKRAEEGMGIGKIVAIVMGIIFLVLVISGLITGAFVSLKDKLSASFDSVLSLLHISKTSSVGAETVSVSAGLMAKYAPIDFAGLKYIFDDNYKILVKTNSACGYSQTSQIRVWTATGYLFFVWDARLGESGKPLVREDNSIKLMDLGDVEHAPYTKKMSVYINTEPGEYTLGKTEIRPEDYRDILLPLMQTKTYFEFLNKLTEIGIAKTYTLESIDVVSGAYKSESLNDKCTDVVTCKGIIGDYLIKTNLNYLPQWINGKCDVDYFTCNFNGEKLCDFDGTNFCNRGEPQTCGSSCLCLKNYKTGYILDFNSGGEDWHIKLEDSQIKIAQESLNKINSLTS